MLRPALFPLRKVSANCVRLGSGDRFERNDAPPVVGRMFGLLRRVDSCVRPLGSALLTVALLLGLAGSAFPQSSIAFVQGNFATPQGSTISVQVVYPVTQTAGNLNVVAVGWNDTNAQIQSVTDSRGNSYVRAIGPTTRNGLGSLSMYF